MRALGVKYQGEAQVIRLNVDAPEVQVFLKKYNVRGTPTIVLLDRHGRVAANVPGWSSTQQVTQALDTLVAQP